MSFPNYLVFDELNNSEHPSSRQQDTSQSEIEMHFIFSWRCYNCGFLAGRSQILVTIYVTVLLWYILLVVGVENIPNRLKYLNIWSPIGGTVCWTKYVTVGGI